MLKNVIHLYINVITPFPFLPLALVPSIVRLEKPTPISLPRTTYLKVIKYYVCKYDWYFRYSVASFLSPTQARRVWPCFDEPSLKANFSVTIIHPPEYTALSNMPSTGDPELYDEGGWLRTRFETTPKMSTYLVAFVVCDYSHSSTMLRDDLEVRHYIMHVLLLIRGKEWRHGIIIIIGKPFTFQFAIPGKSLTGLN